jgi:PhnB protein
MPITPGAYLFFPGSTERAIAFCQVFGGQITITRRGGVGPAASEAEKDQVVNALLTGGDVTFRAGYRDDAALDAQTRVELPVLGTGEPRLRAIFDGLANGGTVRVRLAGRFWGGAFGASTGRYGIGWQAGIGSAGACGPGRPRCHAAANTAPRGGGEPAGPGTRRMPLPAGQW